MLAGSPLFREFAYTYLEWHEQEYPDSHERVEDIVVRVLKPFHNLRLADVQTFDVERWKQERGREVSKGTLLKELRTLSAVFNRAKIWRVTDHNPVVSVSKPRDKAGSPPIWYTPAQLQRLYAAAGHHASWWQLMANTGLRRGEAQHLRWADISDGRLHVLSREGERTKSGKWRHIPLSTGAQAALEALRDADGSEEYVLPPMAAESLSRAFRRDARAAGLPGNLHCLRHTFCSALVQRGVSLRIVQELAGHASIRTTERYAHLAPENVEAAVSGLEL